MELRQQRPRLGVAREGEHGERWIQVTMSPGGQSSEISLVWSAAHYRGCALNANYHLTLQVPQRHAVPQQPPLLLHGGEQGQADPGGARPGAHQEAAAQLWPVGCVAMCL